jgi:hypothetical protein
LHIILDYYLNDLDNFDVLNIDLVDQAKTFVERKTRREAHLKALDPDHKRLIEEILQSHTKHRSSMGTQGGNSSDIIMSDAEREVRALIEKYAIIVNRKKLGEESLKGYNKCKDNVLAFIQHKKGTLFPRRGVLDAYQIEQGRRIVFDEIQSTIKKIDEDQPHRKEVYDTAYKQYISPRMTNSPNSSFITLNRG